MLSDTKLILASGSPRRAELLRKLDLNFQIIKPDTDESILPGETPQDYVRRISVCKYVAACDLCMGDVLVLCADTIVVHNQDILGKPKNKADGMRMLQRLSGNAHQVLTSVTLGKLLSEPSSFTVETNVKFRGLDLNECEAYWETLEPKDKAGGYSVQGMGMIFVETIIGSYSNVVGLPIQETANALRHEGLSILGLPSN